MGVATVELHYVDGHEQMLRTLDDALPCREQDASYHSVADGTRIPNPIPYIECDEAPWLHVFVAADDTVCFSEWMEIHEGGDPHGVLIAWTWRLWICIEGERESEYWDWDF